MAHKSDLTATVVITTKDRVDDLRQALESCVSQSVTPEIIVVDDASTDGTREMLQEQFPQVRCITHESPTGYIVGRNEAANAATADIIFSIDDDAMFTSPDIIRDTLHLFREGRVGAVAIPFVDVKKSPEIHQLANSPNELWITDRYIGTAHAVRKSLFIELGGYREEYFHQGEERDFCQRLLNSGFYVRLGCSAPIHHFESPKRDTRRMDVYGRRNDVLFLWFNAPALLLPFYAAGTLAKGTWFGLRVGRPWRMLKGLGWGLWDSLKFFRERSPVSITAFRMFRKLQKHDEHHEIV